MHIDVNADLGETIDGVPVSDDDAVLTVVSSANVACGFHAGTPSHIAGTLAAATARGVSVGAHVSYDDRPGFGRTPMEYDPAVLADEVLYQIGALDALARAAGTRIAYVKPHGALYNRIVHDDVQAGAVVAGVRAFGDLPLLVLPGSVVERRAAAVGLRPVREAFADRGYAPDGTLVPRTEPGAIVADPDAVADRVVRLADRGTLLAVDGSEIRVDAESICVHGDSPGSVALARTIREALLGAGARIEAFA